MVAWLTRPTLRRQDRKFFDSGDYALSKAGVAPQTTAHRVRCRRRIDAPSHAPDPERRTCARPCKAGRAVLY